MSEVKIVTNNQDARRLDFAVRDLFEVSWIKARSWIKDGKISVDKKRIIQDDLVVTSGQQIVLIMDAPKPDKQFSVKKENIIFMDTHIIVANKPSGILTIPFDRTEKLTFDKQIRNYLSKLSKKNSSASKQRGALPSLMIVHRIDKGTSGLLVFARTFLAKENLAIQFREHSITRRYDAIVHGLAQSKTIKSHFLADRGDGIRGSSENSLNIKVRKSKKGKVAITHIEQREKLKNSSFVSCTLETGRTNQIRIHLSEDGHPLVGERTYMRGFKGQRIESPRLMLHAGELGFDHPITGEKMLFKQPMPEDFVNMLKSLQKNN